MIVFKDNRITCSLKMSRNPLFLLLLFSPMLCASAVKLDRSEIAALLQKPQVQRTIQASKRNWEQLTPQQLNQTEDPDTLLAQEWVVNNQLLRLLGSPLHSSPERDWIAMWQSYRSKVFDSNDRPLFSITDSATSLARRWRAATELQVLLHKLTTGNTIIQLAETAKGRQLLLNNWPAIPTEQKHVFRQTLRQSSVEPQLIPLAIALLQDETELALAQRLIEGMSPADLNLYSGQLEQLFGQSHAALLHHAIGQPALANTALPLLCEAFFDQPQTQTLLFSHLGNENSGVTSAAMLANHGGKSHWQQLSQLLDNASASPLSRYNALLALQLSEDPQTKPLLEKITPEFQEKLRKQMLQ